MPNINLRDYQKSSIDQLRKGYAEGHVRQILAASTGSGKSIIAMSILDSAKNRGSRVMFVCDRRVLVDQFSRHLDRNMIEHGCIMANHWNYNPQRSVQVASIQTLERMKAWYDCDVLIVDEIHAVMRKSLKKFIEENPSKKIIGLTATPFQKDIGGYFTNVVNVITMKELVEQGFLVPFKVYVAKQIDTTGVKIVAGEWQKDDLESRSLEIVGDVVAEYMRLSNTIFGRPKKTICFSSGVAHSQELAQRFATAGLNFVSISYLDTDEYKQQVLEDFAKPDSDINGVISSDILVRGFDQTDVEHVIIARPLRKAFSMHVQMVGRGARPHPDKKFCVIQDHSGNWLRFEDDWENLYENGVKKLKADVDTKTRKEPTEKEKKESKCPACSALWPKGSDSCASCGYVRQRKAIESVAGEMVELKSGKKVSFSERQAFYSELLHIAHTQNYNPNWASHKYKNKFGVWPNGLDKTMIPPSLATKNWVKRATIAWVKGRQKGAA